jgi:hypothetical protein
MSRKTDEAHVCKFVQWIAYGLEEQELESRNKEASFLFSKTSRPTLGPTEPHIQLVPELFPWRDVDHSIPPSAEVKNEWSYTPTPATCLQSVDKDKFTFTFFTLLKYTHKATSHMSAICTEWKSNSKIMFSRHNLSILKHAQKEWWLVVM